MSVNTDRIFAILALIVSALWFVAAATDGPVAQDVSSGIFAASAGFTVLRLLGKLRDRP